MSDPSSTSSDRESSASLEDLSGVVRQAHSGLRSDVAKLIAMLERGGLLIPLAKHVEDDALREDEVRLSPHLLVADDGSELVPLFTDADLLTTFAGYANWKTEADELEYCTLPARTALQLAEQLVDETRIVAAVINPADEAELVLTRSELGALCQGQAVPLVGYVGQFPARPDESSLIAELDEEPSAELLASIEQLVAEIPEVVGYRLRQTFHRERDLEPHPTLTLLTHDRESIDRERLQQRITELLEGKLPPPGYIDVLFEETTTSSASSSVSEPEPH